MQFYVILSYINLVIFIFYGQLKCVQQRDAEKTDSWCFCVYYFNSYSLGLMLLQHIKEETHNFPSFLLAFIQTKSTTNNQSLYFWQQYTLCTCLCVFCGDGLVGSSLHTLTGSWDSAGRRRALQTQEGPSLLTSVWNPASTQEMLSSSDLFIHSHLLPPPLPANNPNTPWFLLPTSLYYK